MKRFVAAALAAGALMASASAANALTDFRLEINTGSNGTPDTPLFILTNLSDFADIVGFSLDFEPSPSNIDVVNSFTRVNDDAPGIVVTVVDPDSSDNSVRSDGLRLSFTGFGASNPDETLRFKVDFDPDSGNSGNADFRTILFNNGALNNAVLKVTFSDETRYTQTLGDGPIQTTYVYTGLTPAGVPEPASWALMIGGFAGVGSMLRRNRRQAAASAA